MTQEIREKMERLAENHQSAETSKEIFEEIINGEHQWTHIYLWAKEDFKSGFTAAHQLMSERVESLEAQNQRLRVDSKLTALKECQEKLSGAFLKMMSDEKTISRLETALKEIIDRRGMGVKRNAEAIAREALGSKGEDGE